MIVPLGQLFFASSFAFKFVESIKSKCIKFLPSSFVLSFEKKSGLLILSGEERSL